MLASKMYRDGINYCSGWNFGPNGDSIVTVKHMVDILINKWGSGRWVDISDKNEPHEAKLLSLDCTKAKTYLNWLPKLSIDEALEFTVEWYKYFNTKDCYELCVNQIEDYCNK